VYVQVQGGGFDVTVSLGYKEFGKCAVVNDVSAAVREKLHDRYPPCWTNNIS